MTTYRPSCVARLQIRLDEGANTSNLESKLESDDAFTSAFNVVTNIFSNASKVFQQKLQLEKQKGSIPENEFKKQLEKLNKNRDDILYSGSQTKPDGLKDNIDDNTVVFVTLPLTCEINRNSQDCDTCTITIRFSDLPIDPRAVRSIFAVISLGNIEQQDFIDGINNKRRSDGSLFSQVKYELGQENTLSGNTRFVGVGTNYQVDYNEDGDEITLEFADVSVMLRNIKLTEQYRIDLEKPLRIGVSELIDKFPSTRGLNVVFNDGTSDGPKPIDSFNDVIKASKKKNARSSDKTVSMYEHIFETCQKLGFSVILRGFTLQILEARDKIDPKRLRAMVYGRNISTLNLSRKLEGVKTETIEIRCYDPKIARTRWARYPVLNDGLTSGILGETKPIPTRANSVQAGGTAEDKVLVYTVSGISDNETLERIARNTFETIARQEIEGSFTTNELTSFSSSQDNDLLDLQAGDPIAVYLASGTEIKNNTNAIDKNGIPKVGFSSFVKKLVDEAVQSDAQKLANFSFGQKVQYLKDLGLNAKVANKIAKAEQLVALTAIFRINYIKMSFSQDDGVEINCSFINYIELRQ